MLSVTKCINTALKKCKYRVEVLEDAIKVKACWLPDNNPDKKECGKKAKTANHQKKQVRNNKKISEDNNETVDQENKQSVTPVPKGDFPEFSITVAHIVIPILILFWMYVLTRPYGG